MPKIQRTNAAAVAGSMLIASMVVAGSMLIASMISQVALNEQTCGTVSRNRDRRYSRVETKVKYAEKEEITIFFSVKNQEPTVWPGTLNRPSAFPRILQPLNAGIGVGHRVPANSLVTVANETT